MPDRGTPKPGRGVRGSTTGRPLMAAMDLLGRRWSLRILWELRSGRTGPRALQAKCDGMSSSVLYDRLRELGESGLVERTPDDQYVLSEVGRALASALKPLDGGQVVGDVAAKERLRPLRGARPRVGPRTLPPEWWLPIGTMVASIKDE